MQMPPGMQMPHGMPPQQGQQPGGGLSDELINQTLSGYGQEDQRGIINRQRKMADMLRQDAGNQLKGGGMVSGHYVGPNLGNLAASMFAGYGAGQMDTGANADATKLGSQEGDAMRGWFRRMTQGRQG